MASPDIPNSPLNPDLSIQEPFAITEPHADESPARDSASADKRPWLLGLGLILLLAGGGFGWYWLQTSRSQGNNPMAAQMGGVPVTLETIQPATVRDASEFIGTLEAQSAAVIRPETEGRVRQIFVQAGDRVAAGTPLVQLSPDRREAELASVLASVNSARAVRANAFSQLQALQADQVATIAEVELQEEEFRRTASLVEEGVLAQQALDIAARNRRRAIANLSAIDQRIEAARANLGETEAALQQTQAQANLAQVELQDTTVVAPFAGIIGDIPARLGDFVNQGDTLTSITQNEALDLRISIPLERQARLREGLQVELSDPQGNPLGTGVISFISPQVEASAQSILAKATFQNASGRLLNGQFVRARVVWEQQTGILVPTTAISRLGGQTFVFVAQPAPAPASEGGGAPANGQPGGPPNGQPILIAAQRPVTLGNIQGNSYQVLEGLQAGESIVVSGILNLSDGVPIMPQSQPPGRPQ